MGELLLVLGYAVMCAIDVCQNVSSHSAFWRQCRKLPTYGGESMLICHNLFPKNMAG